MTRLRLHAVFRILLAGFLALTLVAGPGCGFIVKHAAGMVVKKVAKDQYEHFKDSREKNARAKKSRSRPSPSHEEDHSDGSSR